MKKILIIGKNSYLAEGLEFDKTRFEVEKIRRPLDANLETYNNYDYIINFCIQPEHFFTILSDEEMIDVEITKNIKNPNTKFIYLSSRKVYGSSTELKTYNETSPLKPFDFYSKNKCNIEKALQTIIPNNLTILRTGNIIGLPSHKKSYNTFIGWLEAEFNKKHKITCTINKHSKKDYITRDYFQEALIAIVENNLTETFNIGSNFALTTEELLLNILPSEYVDFSPKETESEQFILDCAKLHKYVRTFTKEELKEQCTKLREVLLS